MQGEVPRWRERGQGDAPGIRPLIFCSGNSFTKNSLKIYEKKCMRPVQQETIGLISACSAAILPAALHQEQRLAGPPNPWRWNSSPAAAGGVQHLS